MKECGVRTYCSEPKRGRRQWKGLQKEKAAVYDNRRRIRGDRGKRLLRQRGERVERSFAHMYETGGMRRTHLRRHDNIIKRLLIHAGAFNLGLAMRKITGYGTPRGSQGRAGQSLTPSRTRGLQLRRWFLGSLATLSNWTCNVGARCNAWILKSSFARPILPGFLEMPSTSGC